MTPEQQNLLMMRGVESQLPERERARCRQCELALKELIRQFGDIGKFAAGLVVLELATETD